MEIELIVVLIDANAFSSDPGFENMCPGYPLHKSPLDRSSSTLRTGYIFEGRGNGILAFQPYRKGIFAVLRRRVSNQMDPLRSHERCDRPKGPGSKWREINEQDAA